MNRREFETLLLTLESTPAVLARAAELLSPEQARLRPAAGGFSFVESVWHLADLEREGYGIRIQRLLQEDRPALMNFDGDRAARERVYQERDVERGLALFRHARTQNLEILRTLSAEDWKRSGAQEGVGCVRLADIPRMMVEHDRGHEQEIAALIASIQGRAPSEGMRPSSAVA